MAPIYLGKMVVPSSLRYIENLALVVGEVQCSMQSVVQQQRGKNIY